MKFRTRDDRTGKFWCFLLNQKRAFFILYSIPTCQESQITFEISVSKTRSKRTVYMRESSDDFVNIKFLRTPSGVNIIFDGIFFLRIKYGILYKRIEAE